MIYLFGGQILADGIRLIDIIIDKADCLSRMRILVSNIRQ